MVEAEVATAAATGIQGPPHKPPMPAITEEPDCPNGCGPLKNSGVWALQGVTPVGGKQRYVGNADGLLMRVWQCPECCAAQFYAAI